MDKNYKGLIWTNHAITRLKERGISQGDAWATWNHPDRSKKGVSPGSWVYWRNYGTTQIEVVAKKNERNEWIILSVWSSQSKNTKQKKSLIHLLLRILGLD